MREILEFIGRQDRQGESYSVIKFDDERSFTRSATGNYETFSYVDVKLLLYITARVSFAVQACREMRDIEYHFIHLSVYALSLIHI